MPDNLLLCPACLVGGSCPTTAQTLRRAQGLLFHGVDAGGLRLFLNMKATWIAAIAAVVGMLQGMILCACSFLVDASKSLADTIRSHNE